MNAGPKPLIRPFTFDQSFDDEDDLMPAAARHGRKASVADSPPAPPAPPVFTQADLQAAHEEGYREGQAAARIEAAESTERATAATLERLALALESLDRERAEANDSTARMAAEVAVGIARKLFPHLAEIHGLDEIEAMIRQSLASLLTAVKITIRVAPDAVAPIQERLESVVAQAGFEGQAMVIGDPAVGLGDSAIDWGDGGATHDSVRIWREIDAAVHAMTSRQHDEMPAAKPAAAAAPAGSESKPASEPAGTGTTPVRPGPQPKVRPVGPPRQATEPAT